MLEAHEVAGPTRPMGEARGAHCGQRGLFVLHQVSPLCEVSQGAQPPPSLGLILSPVTWVSGPKEGQEAVLGMAGGWGSRWLEALS